MVSLKHLVYFPEIYTYFQSVNGGHDVTNRIRIISWYLHWRW